MEGSSAHGSVDLDNLTNFPQVIIPPKFMMVLVTLAAITHV